MPDARIAVVDDEPEPRSLVRSYLEREGFHVVEAASGFELLDSLQAWKPDLIILDIMMPKMDGFEVLRQLAKYPYVPVLMLTARGDEDKIISLEMGADDYLTKPFDPRELVARVKAIVRRKELMRQGAASSGPPLTFGSLMVDLEKKQVWLDGNPLQLTATELAILRLFALNPGKIFSRDELLDRIWGEDFPGERRTVDVHVNNLKRKLSIGGSPAQFVQSVRGLGYRFLS